MNRILIAGMLLVSVAGLHASAGRANNIVAAPTNVISGALGVVSGAAEETSAVITGENRRPLRRNINRQSNMHDTAQGQRVRKVTNRYRQVK